MVRRNLRKHSANRGDWTTHIQVRCIRLHLVHGISAHSRWQCNTEHGKLHSPAQRVACAPSHHAKQCVEAVLRWLQRWHIYRTRLGDKLSISECHSQLESDGQLRL